MATQEIRQHLRGLSTWASLGCMQSLLVGALVSACGSETEKNVLLKVKGSVGITLSSWESVPTLSELLEQKCLPVCMMQGFIWKTE